MNKIIVRTEVKGDVAKVWKYWNDPEHMTHWQFASLDWECPSVQNDLRKGGRFKIRMQAKNGSEGFDFEGTYTAVESQKHIAYVMDDTREVMVTFEVIDENRVKVTEEFDPETQNTEELQRTGWQAILDNFKKYVENT